MLNPKSPEGYTAWDYGQTIVDLLHSIKTAVENARGNDPIPRRIPFLIRCDASGNGQEELQLPLGVNWQLGGISFQASATGYVATYVNEEDGRTLLKTNPSGVIVSDVFVDTEVTHDDIKILLVARGQTANTVVSGNLRVSQYEATDHDPVKTQ